MTFIPPRYQCDNCPATVGVWIPATWWSSRQGEPRPNDKHLCPACREHILGPAIKVGPVIAASDEVIQFNNEMHGHRTE